MDTQTLSVTEKYVPDRRPVKYLTGYLCVWHLKHEYYTTQEILDGTEERIIEMIHTVHKNHTDRHSKVQESPGDPTVKRQKQQSLLKITD